MKIHKKLNDLIKFIFPFINVLKKLLHFLYFKLITLLRTCLAIIFFWGLVNDTFSNLKLNYCWLCGNKYVKQVVWINHSWISPTLQRGWGTGVMFNLQKWRKVHFSPKKGEVGKIVEEGCLGRVTYICCWSLCL